MQVSNVLSDLIRDAKKGEEKEEELTPAEKIAAKRAKRGQNRETFHKRKPKPETEDKGEGDLAVEGSRGSRS